MKPRRFDEPPAPNLVDPLTSAIAALRRAWAAAKGLGDEDAMRELQDLGRRADRLLERLSDPRSGGLQPPR